jgi:hypothetical protein
VTAEATFVSTTSISGVTYTIENLTDEDRDFVIGSVACGSLPGGWSGTVLANGEASLYVPVSPPEACHLQDSQVDLFDGSELDCGFPVQMYVPASQREYVGGNSIASAVHVSGTTRNTISFSVTGQPATTAVLYRVDDGAYVRVATAAGSFTSGNTYVMHDEDSLPGTTIYVVQTGRGVNGEYSSQPEEVVW